jgi:AcrR family transcriptional regulator
LLTKVSSVLPKNLPKDRADLRQRQTRRPPLNRERLLSQALDFVDRHGLEQLTMRALAEELGVDPMTVYRHVESREDMLDGILATTLAELRVEFHPEDDWQQHLRKFAHGFRRLVLVHRQRTPAMSEATPSTRSRWTAASLPAAWTRRTTDAISRPLPRRMKSTPALARSAAWSCSSDLTAAPQGNSSSRFTIAADPSSSRGATFVPGLLRSRAAD